MDDQCIESERNQQRCRDHPSLSQCGQLGYWPGNGDGCCQKQNDNEGAEEQHAAALASLIASGSVLVIASGGDE